MSFLPYRNSSAFGWMGAFGASAVAHAALIAGILAAYGSALRVPEPEADRPEFTITLERLDADTLAGIIEQDGAAGSESDTPSDTTEPAPETDINSPEADPLEPVAPDPVEVAVEPEPAPEPEPVPEPETPEPEVPEAIPPEELSPEEVAPVEAEVAATPEPIAPEAITPGPIEAEPLIATPIAPDDPDLNPILPETVEATSLSPSGLEGTALSPVTPLASTATALAPVAPQSNGALAAITPPPSTAQTVTAINRPPAPAPVSTQPTAARPPAPPPTAQDLAIGDLIGRIRAEVSSECLIALPRRDGPDGVGLAMIAAQDSAMETFAQTVLTAEDEDIRQTRTLVDPRQCPALTYIRQNLDYPATRMGLRIDNLEIASGDRMTGVLRGGTGRYITLLLVDDNGVVQDLQRFLSFSGNLARFDVPMTRDGPTRDTSQILLAIATKRPPDVIKARNGQVAQDVFTGLDGELGPEANLAVATIDVR